MGLCPTKAGVEHPAVGAGRGQNLPNAGGMGGGRGGAWCVPPHPPCPPSWGLGTRWGGWMGACAVAMGTALVSVVMGMVPWQHRVGWGCVVSPPHTLPGTDRQMGWREGDAQTLQGTLCLGHRGKLRHGLRLAPSMSTAGHWLPPGAPARAGTGHSRVLAATPGTHQHQRRGRAAGARSSAEP